MPGIGILFSSFLKWSLLLPLSDIQYSAWWLIQSEHFMRKGTRAMKLSPAELARQVLKQARDLRERIREDLRLRRWGSEDIQMEHYNHLIGTAAGLFLEDPVLRNMIQMPDANLQTYYHPIGELIGVGKMAPDLASTRLETRLNEFIDRLELLVGEPAGPVEAPRPAREVLSEQDAGDVRSLLDAIEALRAEQQEQPALEFRNFSLIENPNLRQVLVLDYRETQQAFAAGAYKASAILSAGLIEGMLLDWLMRPSVAQDPRFEGAASQFPRIRGEINWDRVSLTSMIQAAGQLQLLDHSVLRMAEGARDFRDTTHPRAEVREGVRAFLEEAELLLALVKLVYRQLGGVLVQPDSPQAD